MTGIVEYLLANPIFLAPILLLGAMLVFAILKKLVKVAVILAIAGALYLLLLEYFGRGA
jgi:hypothetical protein